MPQTRPKSTAKIMLLMILLLASLFLLSACMDIGGLIPAEVESKPEASRSIVTGNPTLEDEQERAAPSSPEASRSTDPASETDALFQSLFDSQAEDIAVSGTGAVIRLLSDDTEGDKHQRFIVELASGQTLLIVHNIDIAPRVDPLAVGDAVSFVGEYVWNEEGGLVHWTHHDPDGTHAGGSITREGAVFQ